MGRVQRAIKCVTHDVRTRFGVRKNNSAGATAVRDGRI
jgi:hypothetical protein